MRKTTYLIIGGGPSGLALAHSLIDRGIPAAEVLVLEKEKTAGGLCRSEIVDGAPIDIGGGHFLDMKHREVTDFIFRFMPESEWACYDRIAKIHLHGLMVDHPLEAHLGQLGAALKTGYMDAVASAGSMRGAPAPVSFGAWVRWKFGDRIANDYMLPYNRKLWGIDPDLLGTHWLNKLPDVSVPGVRREGKPSVSLPAHKTFLYPKSTGYGEVWRRMGGALGDSLITGARIAKIDLDTLTINGEWQARHIFNSIPWHEWKKWTVLPDAITEDIEHLRHIGIDVDYVPVTHGSPAHWIYEPDEALPHHRKLLRANFQPGSRGHWTETNSLRSPEKSAWRHTSPYAYPAPVADSPRRVARILEWARTKNITGFGRWGAWEHMNSDIAVKNAIALAHDFAKERSCS